MNEMMQATQRVATGWSGQDARSGVRPEGEIDLVRATKAGDVNASEELVKRLRREAV